MGSVWDCSIERVLSPINGSSRPNIFLKSWQKLVQIGWDIYDTRRIRLLWHLRLTTYFDCCKIVFIRTSLLWKPINKHVTS